MVNSIDPIDSLQAIQQVKPLENEEQAAQTTVAPPPEAQPTTTDSFEGSQNVFTDFQIKDYVATYVNNLIAKYEGYDDSIIEVGICECARTVLDLLLIKKIMGKLEVGIYNELTIEEVVSEGKEKLIKEILYSILVEGILMGKQ